MYEIVGHRMKDEWKVNTRESLRMQKGYFPIARISIPMNLVFSRGVNL
jgi:hypothetical protein